VITTCDQTAGLTYNGDDAIALECDGATVDVLGQVGFDPGTAWGSGEVSLLDHTLRRLCSVTQGDTNPSDAFDPAVEWSGLPTDSFDDLGQRVCP
jgi:predicted extracellular nuclease